MSALPREITVAGRRWALIERDGGEAVFEDQYGLTRSEVAEILLADNAPQPRTILHELAHAAEEALDSEISHDAISAIAAGIADALISAPALADWIAERARGKA